VKATIAANTTTSINDVCPAATAGSRMTQTAAST